MGEGKGRRAGQPSMGNAYPDSDPRSVLHDLHATRAEARRRRNCISVMPESAQLGTAEGGVLAIDEAFALARVPNDDPQRSGSRGKKPRDRAAVSAIAVLESFPTICAVIFRPVNSFAFYFPVQSALEAATNDSASFFLKIIFENP